MSFTLIFKPLAEAEVADAFAWYSQPDIGMGREFLDELGRIERFIRFNPLLYPRVEDDIRRASLRRFPYSLFYLIDESQVQVLSCFHQHRDPTDRAHLLGK
jgi:plasmid stabilization system protein ParE